MRNMLISVKYYYYYWNNKTQEEANVHSPSATYFLLHIKDCQEDVNFKVCCRWYGSWHKCIPAEEQHVGGTEFLSVW